jgi:hypothetical protein
VTSGYSAAAVVQTSTIAATMSVARFIAERFNIICHCGVEQKRATILAA